MFTHRRPITIFAAALAFALAAPLSARATCAMRTDYSPTAGCSGTFLAATPADLAAYAASDFGRSGGANYKNLKLTGNLSGTALDIESPCTITLADGLTLDAGFVSLDGRKGVEDDNGYTVHADEVCVLSAEGNADLGQGSAVTASSLTVQAPKRAKIGLDSTIALTGELLVRSTGDFTSSVAEIRAGSHVSASAIRVESQHAAFLGENTVSQAGTIALVSAGNATSSETWIKQGAQVMAGTLSLSAPRMSRIGEDTAIQVTGDLLVRSTGSFTGSSVEVAQGAHVTAGGHATLESGNQLLLGLGTELVAAGDLLLQAQTEAKCTLRNTAFFAASRFAGNCIPDVSVAGVALQAGVARLAAQFGAPLAIAGTYTGDLSATSMALSYAGQTQTQTLGASNFGFTVQASTPSPVVIAVSYAGAPNRPPEIRFTLGAGSQAAAISASVAPAPNAAGWHRTPVTVSFQCTGPVQSCPAPVVVSTDGDAQLITGTALDSGGNALTASATIRLDQTPPEISVSPSAAANGAGWHREPVTVAFACSDATSGTTGCPAAALVETEGAGQEVSGSVTDVAGNTASASLIVNLDRSAPQITITFPVAGSLTKDATVPVAGTVLEANAVPVFTVGGVQTPLANLAFLQNVPVALGDNVLEVAAVDIAGNTASATVLVRRVLCLPGEARSCFDGPAGAAGVGICAAGSQLCAEGGLAFGACTGQTLPGVETCDGLDNDCDASVDDGVSVASTCGVGACAAQGMCVAGGESCTPGTPQAESAAAQTCGDGIDNDCDGEADGSDRDCFPHNPPAITSTPARKVGVGQTYVYDVEATDPDAGDTLTFSLDGLDSERISIDPSTGVLQATPTAQDVGSYPITVRVRDSLGLFDTQTFTLEVVADLNREPVFESEPQTAVVLTGGSDTPQPVNLSNWTEVPLTTGSDQGPANWVVSADGRSVLQNRNGDAGLFLADFPLENDHVEGTIRVAQNNDDDHVGFIWGYQNPTHFYLLN